MRRFSTSAATSSSQWQMKFFPPSLPTPPYPAPDLIPIKAQLRRTSAPATSHTCYDPKSSNNNRKVSRKNNDRVGEKHSEKANENSLSLLSPELLSNSPPQSVTAESISHSEFDNLFVANVNFSTDNDPSSKIRDDTCKSSSSHYSEESLLTALVKCQSVLRESYEKSLSKHQMQGDSTEIVPNERLINVNDRKCLISCLNDDRSNQDRPKLHFRNNEVTEGNELSDGASNEKSHMIRRRITIAGERPSLVYTQKSTSPRHPQTDKEGNDTACHRHNETQNLGRVAIAKLNWENYFIPKPPRIAKNKITKDDRITRSVTVETKHEVGQFFRSNSVDCAYRVYDSDPNINNEVEITNVEKQYNNSYKDHLKTRRFKCISTPVSPVYSASDSPRTVSPATRSHISQNEIRNDNSMKSKYIGKGYSPSFIRLIYDNELDDQKQQTDESTYATHESCDLDMTNGKTSSSTLTLTENTTTTKDHDIKQNINTTDKQTVLEKKEFVSVENEFNKRLCTSDIQYSNCNAKNISEDCYRIARPLSVTLKRHRIRFPKLKTNGRQTSLSSSDSSEDFDHKYEEEYDNDKDTILEESNCLYMSTENKQTDFPLNKHAHWQRMYVEKDRLFRRMNKTIHENDTQIDHLTSPIDKPLTYVRSHSADYNPTLIHPRIRSQSAGIDRSESFHKVVSHITSGVKLTTHQELLHTRLNSTENDSKFLSSFISPISINTSLSSNIIRNDSAQVFRDDKHSATKKDNCKSRTRLNKEIFLNKQLLPSPSSFCRVPKICTNNVLLCQNKLGKNYDDNSDEHVDVIDDHRVKKVNCKPEIMSLSPAARRYEEHVLAAVSGKGCNKFGNQIFFGDNKNCLTRQNTLKNVKISPDGIYTNKPTDTVNYQNYDEGSDSVDHQKEDAINAEIWREKLGAITRWRREVDSAMLAGETDIKEILCNPEIPFSDSFVENPYCLSNIPFNNEAINYFQTSPVQITSFQPHDPCFASKGLQTQFLPTYGVPLKPFQTCAKPVMGAGEQCRNYLPKNTLPHTYQVRPETTRNTNLFGNIHANDQPYIADTTKNYQQPSHAIPSKVVINPSAAPNNYLHQNINSRLNSSSPVNHQHQQTWLKAPSLNLPSTRQRVNSESVAVLQPVGPTQSHTNMLYSANNNPCNLETKTQMPIPSHESNLVIPNMNSTNASNKNQTIRSFRNFFTPKLRRKTYEMNKTEPAGFKQDLFSTTNKLQSSSGGQSSTNNSRSPTAINLPNQYNQFNKVTPSSSYTDALNLAVAANAALCEAFHQSIPSTDSCQRTNLSNQNISLKPRKFKTHPSTIQPECVIASEQSSTELSLTPNEIGQTENKNKPWEWAKITRPCKNISLSTISSSVQSGQDDKSDANKSKNLTVEQIFNANSKRESPKLLVNEKKSNEVTDTNVETRRAPGRLRSNLRHAVTLSPCRRKPDLHSEQWNSPYLEPGPLALSSGFVSAGSIVNAVEDSNGQMNKEDFAESSSKVKSIPPPVCVQDYPIVCNLEKDLNTIPSLIDDIQKPQDEHIQQIQSYQDLKMPSKLMNNSPTKQHKQQRFKINRTPPLQTLPPCKLLLGRVASNEDICIETETPFAFNIAATDKEICITRVASVGDLEYQQQQNQQDMLSTDQEQEMNQINKSVKKKKKGIPISLRLTFGSESKLNKSSLVNSEDQDQVNASQIKNYRAMYYVDIPQGCRTSELRRRSNRVKNSSNTQNVTRYSLPCISYCEESPKPISLLPPLATEKNR